MATIEDIEKLVKAYATKYPQSQAVFDRAEYDKALQQYGPEKTAVMIDDLYKQLIEVFTEYAAVYDANSCHRHPKGGCVCNKKG